MHPTQSSPPPLTPPSDASCFDHIVRANALTVPPGRFGSSVAIADRLSELKRHAKRAPGNHLLIERRQR